MATATAKAKQSVLPKSATITIREQHPSPRHEIEVTPDGGRVHFENKDKREYRLRFWRPKTDPNAGIDILLPAGGSITVVIKKHDIFEYSVTVVIKKHDIFEYSVMRLDSPEVENGQGGGPIRN